MGNSKGTIEFSELLDKPRLRKERETGITKDSTVLKEKKERNEEKPVEARRMTKRGIKMWGTE
jgi:hypothetical protein